MMETPERPATATETDVVISEPISVFFETAVAVTSGEENDIHIDEVTDRRIPKLGSDFES